MRYRDRLQRLVWIVFAAVFAACGGSGGSGNAIPTASNVDQNRAEVLSSGHFAQHVLPAGITPGVLREGPDGGVWFANQGTRRSVAAGRVNAAGTFTPFTLPSTFTKLGGGPSIASAGGAMFTLVVTIANGDVNMARITPGGTITVFPDLSGSLQGTFSMALGADGNLWFPICPDPCLFFTTATLQRVSQSGAIQPPVNMPANYLGTSITKGSDGNMYVTATQEQDNPSEPNSVVFKVSRTGTILNKFVFPQSSGLEDIIAGPDGNLWITENDVNKIGRLTPTGTITHFPLPTANAGPTQIAVGADRALWFTEFNASKIGRITTAGAITEFPTPLASSRPFDIVGCTSIRRIWFTERDNILARFDF